MESSQRNSSSFNNLDKLLIGLNLKNHNHSNSSTPTSRLERLLRERELRRFTRSFHSTDESRDKGYMDILGTVKNMYLSESDKSSQGLDSSQAMASPKPLNDGDETSDYPVPKRRLLVVANRLPVSAVRKKEASWTLEISVGGLVSALLDQKLSSQVHEIVGRIN